MKMTVSENGSALGLSDDSQPGGVQLYANRDKGNFVKVVNCDGRKQTIRPQNPIDFRRRLTTSWTETKAVMGYE